MKKILVLTYWSYQDALVQTYTLPYLRILIQTLPKGSEVVLLTLEKPEYQLSASEAAREWELLKGENITWLAHPYHPFGMKSVVRWLSLLPRLASFVRKEKVSHLHAWCTPAGGLGYLLSRLTGRPLVVDSYEPHAESMVENGTWTQSSLAYRILFRLEKWQSKHAKAVVALTEGMRQYAFEKYGTNFSRYYVKPACVDFSQFDAHAAKDADLVQELGLKDKVVAVYAGKLGGIYLEEEVFDLLNAAFQHWGDRFRAVLLTPNSASEVAGWCEQKGIPKEMVIALYVKHPEVPRYLRLGDFALNPVKPVPSKRYCTSIKDGEYWAMGLPVLIPKNISDDSDIVARHQTGVVLDSLTEKGYQKAIEEMDALLQGDRAALRDRVLETGHLYRNFDIANRIYSELYG